jgi:hypothetical protein
MLINWGRVKINAHTWNLLQRGLQEYLSSNSIPNFLKNLMSLEVFDAAWIVRPNCTDVNML